MDQKELNELYRVYQGDKEAMAGIDLADIYDKLLEVKKLHKAEHYAESVPILEEIANIKSKDECVLNAQFRLGVMYGSGLGMAQDDNASFKWHKKAAEQGYAQSQDSMGACYFHGLGVTKDETKAVEWYRKSAEQGDDDGQNHLGVCYYGGFGVAQDYAQAVEWLRKSADQDNAKAQAQLGTCYYHGDGVEKDYTEAVRWFRMAAGQDNAQGQYYLGCCYYYGNSVAEDETVAAEWFRKAAAQGYESAQKKLDEMKKRNSQPAAAPVTAASAPTPSYSSPSSSSRSYSGGYNPYVEKRGVFLSIVFGLVGGIGVYSIVSRVFRLITGISFTYTIITLVLIAAGFILTFIAWRHRKTGLFVVMIAVSALGFAVNFMVNRGIIPENLSGVLTSKTSAAAIRTATVTSDALNMRSEPSVSGDNIVKTLKKGDTLTVTGDLTENGWAPVQHGDDSGFVSGELISKIITVIEGKSLADKFQWLKTNAAENTEYTIILTDGESSSPQTLSYSDRNNITVRLTGNDEEGSVSLSDRGALITVGSGVTLILDNGVTLNGRDGNNRAVIVVRDKGELIMNQGAMITGNTNTINLDHEESGGGVSVSKGGTFTMNGGEISGNSSTNSVGGGVRVFFGTFTMKGGTITKNSAVNGGGLDVWGETAVMEGGKIIDNNASNHGGGVGIAGNAGFTMKGGEITGNTAPTGPGLMSYGEFTRTGGTINPAP